MGLWIRSERRFRESRSKRFALYSGSFKFCCSLGSNFSTICFKDFTWERFTCWLWNQLVCVCRSSWTLVCLQLQCAVKTLFICIITEWYINWYFLFIVKTPNKLSNRTRKDQHVRCVQIDAIMAYVVLILLNWWKFMRINWFIRIYLKTAEEWNATTAEL